MFLTAKYQNWKVEKKSVHFYICMCVCPPEISLMFNSDHKHGDVKNKKVEKTTN